MEIRRFNKSEKGAALVLVIICAFILSIMGFSLLSLAKAEILLTKKAVNRSKAFYAAEAGIEYAVAMLNKLLGEQRRALYLDGDGDIVDRYEIPFPTTDGFTFDVFTIEKVGSVETRVIDSGPYKGLKPVIQKYKITSQATSDTSDATSARLVQWIEEQGFPLFQFAAFYEQDLELEPGPPMTITGRIHSNHDIYLTSNSTLSIDSYLTSSGNIYRSSKPGDPGEESGTVQIKDAEGDYEDMYFDSSDPDWTNKSLETWGGKVQSQVHGIVTLSLPLPVGAEPIDIINRGDAGDTEALKEARLYYQADLRIIDGVAYDKSGNVVDLTYEKDGSSVNPVDMDKSFYNPREGADVTITEIDISKLVESGKFPANGILYVSTDSAGEQDGVRLVNGPVLPPGGLTVATDNPLYIQGDYNLNKAPASVFCDAINVLSNAWQDGVMLLQSATDTEVNTSFASGHTPTTDAGYGGGLENFPRFLESWSGKKFTMTGSLSSLWFSEIATGEWRYGEPYYNAPERHWGFDEASFSNLPPGTVVLCRTHRSNWQQH